MKSIQITSTPLLSFSDKNENNQKNNLENEKKNFSKEAKSSTISFVNTQKDNKIYNQNLNANNHKSEEAELNYFDICFCLSKDLIDKIENGDEPIKNGEIEFNSVGNFSNKDNCINLPKKNGKFKNINKSFDNGNKNLNEINNYFPVNIVNTSQFNINNNPVNEKLWNNEENIIPQDNMLGQNANFFNHQKSHNQFHFNMPQNNENNNNYNLNENYVNPINQNNNQNNYYFQNLNFNSKNNNMINKNLSKYQPKRIIDNFTLEMFGKIGWICQFCNNFNYETRKKCNRCQNKKQPKKLKKFNTLFSEDNSDDKNKSNWLCKYCGNLNYSFRESCNRCKIQKE